MFRSLLALFFGSKCTLVITFPKEDKSFMRPIRLPCSPAVGWELDLRIAGNPVSFKISQISLIRDDSHWLGSWETYVHLTLDVTNLLLASAILERLKLDKRWSDGMTDEDP